MMGKIVFLTLPIGNLKDLTKRVEEALIVGTCFAVEDSRTFLSLLELLQIPSQGKQWAIWHDQSKNSDINKIEKWLEEGKTVYVVSEAGSPYISDPGYDLLQSLKVKPSSVDSYSGVSAVISALELSELPSIPFTFQGFFARQTNDIKKQLERIENVSGTHVYFLSPHRLIETVDDVLEYFSKDDIKFKIKYCLVREITKKFQEIIKFTVDEWILIKGELQIKGEFVFLIHNTEGEKLKTCSNEIKKLAEDFILEQKPKKLSKLLAEILGKNSSEIYDLLQKNKNDL